MQENLRRELAIAEPLYREALDSEAQGDRRYSVRRAALGDRYQDTLDCISNLGLLQQGDFAAAVSLCNARRWRHGWTHD